MISCDTVNKVNNNYQKLSLIFRIFGILIVGCKMATAEEVESFNSEAKSCCEFSSKFYKIAVGDVEGNVIASPFSVHVILSCLTHGAVGITASEMIDNLSIKNIEQHHIGYKNLLSTFNLINDAKLHLANAAFVHNIELLKTFTTIGNEFYNFSIQNLNFQENIKSAKIINDWVLDKTNNMIVDIIKSSDITDDTRAILVNAIYFKGPWEYPFNTEHTVNKVFHIDKNIRKQVPTMKNKQRYAHGELADLNSKFIEIPYADKNLSMIVILPDETHSLSLLEENFNWNSFVHAEASKREVILYLPKFKIECTLNLKETLQKMGFQSMFEDRADFSGMTVTPVKVSKVIQKAFIEVNEEGSEAAAATVMQIRLKRAMDMPEEFIVNRPFMFIIRHKPSNIPLFIGSVRDIGVNIEKDEL